MDIDQLSAGYRPVSSELELRDLLADIRACRHCEAQLPLGANPVLRASASARVMIVGQAPGTRVHATGIPWNDPSGDRLRTWLQLDRETGQLETATQAKARFSAKYAPPIPP